MLAGRHASCFFSVLNKDVLVPSLTRTLLNAVDRPLLRPALAAASGLWCRLLGQKEVRLFHDGQFWLYQYGRAAFPQSRRFPFYAYDIRNAAKTVAHYQSEVEDCWYHLYTPHTGDVIVDVGAGIGTDTLGFSRSVGPTGKVFAVEAHPETFAKLEATCRANRLDNVIKIHAAVSNDAGTLTLSDGTNDVENFVDPNAPAGSGHQVAANKLDTMLAPYNLQRVDLLKMNIEGAERLAIGGMDETIAKTRYVAIACHDFIAGEWFATRDLVVTYLRDKGFKVVERRDDPRPYAAHHVHGVREG
jgi:FkbM family methyltransferase